MSKLIDEFTDDASGTEYMAFTSDGNLSIQAYDIATKDLVPLRLTKASAERLGITLCRFLQHKRSPKGLVARPILKSRHALAAMGIQERRDALKRKRKDTRK